MQIQVSHLSTTYGDSVCISINTVVWKSCASRNPAFPSSIVNHAVLKGSRQYSIKNLFMTAKSSQPALFPGHLDAKFWNLKTDTAVQRRNTFILSHLLNSITSYQMVRPHRNYEFELFFCLFQQTSQWLYSSRARHHVSFDVGVQLKDTDKVNSIFVFAELLLVS